MLRVKQKNPDMLFLESRVKMFFESQVKTFHSLIFGILTRKPNMFKKKFLIETFSTI